MGATWIVLAVIVVAVLWGVGLYWFSGALYAGQARRVLAARARA